MSLSPVEAVMTAGNRYDPCTRPFATIAMSRFWLPLLLCTPLVTALSTTSVRAEAEPPRVTVIYDAFGEQSALRKDWGFAALIEVDGRRILFDTGNDAETFRHNVQTLDIDLTDIDLLAMSHRHADHMAGLSVVLEANPEVPIYAPQEGFGIYGSSLPSSFYRKDPSLPAKQRYFDGAPPETLRFGSAWPGAQFKPLTETTEIAPGVWAIIAVSDAPGTRELRELSLAIRTDHGLLLVVGCSHPGLSTIVAEAAKIDPTIGLVIGGFHYVNADDTAIAGVIEALKPFDIRYIAPGHCTGEATFTALVQAFGARYLYAGLGARIVLDGTVPARPAGVAALFQPREREAYRQMSLLDEHEHHTLAGGH